MFEYFFPGYYDKQPFQQQYVVVVSLRSFSDLYSLNAPVALLSSCEIYCAPNAEQLSLSGFHIFELFFCMNNPEKPSLMPIPHEIEDKASQGNLFFVCTKDLRV
jgi:hypothetical protein